MIAARLKPPGDRLGNCSPRHENPLPPLLHAKAGEVPVTVGQWGYVRSEGCPTATNARHSVD
jgi:hypothetical protein